MAGARGQARLVVLVDFDGTIARLDLSDEVMRRYADLEAWAPLEAAYLAGEIGSRTLLTRQAAVLHGDTAAIAAMTEGEEMDLSLIHISEPRD